MIQHYSIRIVMKAFITIIITQVVFQVGNFFPLIWYYHNGHFFPSVLIYFKCIKNPMDIFLLTVHNGLFLCGKWAGNDSCITLWKQCSLRLHIFPFLILPVDKFPSPLKKWRYYVTMACVMWILLIHRSSSSCSFSMCVGWQVGDKRKRLELLHKKIQAGEKEKWEGQEEG